MRIVIAPDSFKGTMTAGQAAAYRRGYMTGDSSCAIDKIPIADGGEGTVESDGRRNRWRKSEGLGLRALNGRCG